MRLNPELPISDRNQSRIAAQAIVRSGFNPKLAIAELRPDIKCYGPFFAKLMEEPAIQQEVEKIMSRTERNAQKYLDMVWGWAEGLDAALKSGTPADKATVEAGLAGARILAKGYIREKGKDDGPSKPFAIGGLESIDNLVEAPTDRKKLQ